MEIIPEKIKVKIKFIEEKKLKAILSLDFGSFIVKGFRIMESEYVNCKDEKLWLTPPSYKDSGGRYHPIFFIPNKELWKNLEEKIWDEYSRQRDEYHKKLYGVDEI